MLAAVRRAVDERDEGFTLIELLVVMIIIGILAAIAIPVFLSQRSKARDTSTKSDVSTIGKEVATYYIDTTTAPSLTITSGRYLLAGNDIGAVSSGNALGGTGDATGYHFTSPNIWCVDVTNANGTNTYKYSASSGLSVGVCTSPGDY